MISVGERIKRLRKAKRLTQQALAEKTGLTNTYICDIEKGRTNPSLKSLERISEALEVSPSFLISCDYENNVNIAGAG